MKKLKFDELELSDDVRKAVADMGFEEASPIQSAAIPLLLAGKDIIGQAQTGTGKTAAFAIPTIENIDPAKKNLQAVVMCPTRELVIQVTEEFRKLTRYKPGLETVPVYGGQEIERQLRALKRHPQIIVGTPGRVMDHMRRRSIDMRTVTIAILDEADEMVDMGFREDMEEILKDTPADRQTIMFSATMSPVIVKMMKKFQRSPEIIDVTHHKVNAPKIEQVYFEVQERGKAEVLSRLIEFHNIKLALVFCNTRSQVDRTVEELKARGYFAEGLHGDMSQNQRDKVMQGFRSGRVEILVATDVAGRGIDVNDIEAVFNYDLPRDDEDYTHRIGRTARAGKTGIAFSFVSGKEIYKLKRIERQNGVKVSRREVPSFDDLQETRLQNVTVKIRTLIDAGHLSTYITQTEKIMGDDYTAMDVAAALLKLSADKKATKAKAASDAALMEKPGSGHEARGRGAFRRAAPGRRHERGGSGPDGPRAHSGSNSRQKPRPPWKKRKPVKRGSYEGAHAGFSPPKAHAHGKKKRQVRDKPVATQH